MYEKFLGIYNDDEQVTKTQYDLSIEELSDLEYDLQCACFSLETIGNVETDKKYLHIYEQQEDNKNIYNYIDTKKLEN